MSARGFLLIGLAAVGAAGCDEDLLNPMAARQPRVNSYAASEFYDDLMAMREPPYGTVPRERVVLNPALATGKVAALGSNEAAPVAPPGAPAIAPTYVTTFPIKVDRPLVELGRKKYDITCGACHGPAGDGDSMVARQMSLRPPPSLHLYADRPPGYIFEVITNGFGMMASYAAELSVRERWAVVAYVRALQLSQTATVENVPPDQRANLQEGP